MSSLELMDREDFAMEAASLAQDRFMLKDVWQRHEISVKERMKLQVGIF